jgi:D-alanyl-D-alanine carboxypeptidase/D-alanyl-D-alanine-endopeptidase (penicillin-binding protein 4)
MTPVLQRRFCPRRVAVWLAVSCLALAVRAAEVPEPLRPAHSAAELQSEIEAFVGQARFHGALWGVKVVSLDTGRTLAEHAADRRQSPASNSKLYAGVLALVTLGGDYRIVTPLRATAAVDAAGVVKGDLIVAGRGDPSWSFREAKKDFWAVFEPFVVALHRAAVKRITGDIVADATWLREPPQGASWTADDMDYDYGAEISAVTLADNYVDLRVVPAAVAGQPCAVEVLQPLSGLVFDNRTTTGAAESERVVRVQRLPGESTVHLFGTLPVGGKPELTEAPVPRPAAWFAAALREALHRAGIAVEGRSRALRWPEAPAAGEVALGEVVSPPLRDLVAGFMKPSQNLETDLIFAHVGELRRNAATPAWRQSDELAVAALDEFIARIGVPAGAVLFDEGSGLSRNNLTTAAATVDLLAYMARHRESAAFVASLPVAGVDGSLAKRMKGTAAEGNVRAKTGGLRWANSLSGYVTTAAGEKLAFSLMLNRHVAPPDRKATEDLDQLAVLLARYAGAK